MYHGFWPWNKTWENITIGTYGPSYCGVEGFDRYNRAVEEYLVCLTHNKQTVARGVTKN